MLYPADFEHLAALSALVSPTVTSVRLPLAAMAETMVDRIISRLGDPGIATGEFLFQPTLIARGSVGPPLAQIKRLSAPNQSRTRAITDAAKQRLRRS